MSDSKPPSPREAVKYHKPQSYVKLSNFKDTLSVKNRIHPEVIKQLDNNPYNQSYGYYKKPEKKTISKNKNYRPKI